MPGKRHTPEQIIRKLREAEVELAKGRKRSFLLLCPLSIGSGAPTAVLARWRAGEDRLGAEGSSKKLVHSFSTHARSPARSQVQSPGITDIGWSFPQSERMQRMMPLRPRTGMLSQNCARVHPALSTAAPAGEPGHASVESSSPSPSASRNRGSARHSCSSCVRMPSFMMASSQRACSLSGLSGYGSQASPTTSPSRSS
jgi:hypothetical protein